MPGESPSAWERSGPASRHAATASASSSRSPESSAYRPGEGSGQPDFEQATGAFVPEVHVLYGMAFSREGRGDDGPLRVDGRSPAIAGRSSEQACPGCARMLGRSDTVGVVLIGETAGLVGAALGDRRSACPTGSTSSHTPRPGTGSRSRRSPNMPAAPRWSSVSRRAGRVPPWRRSSGRSRAPGPPSCEGTFTRRSFRTGRCPEDRSSLAPTVQLLFEPGRVETVLHLLGDSRPIVGAGESTFTRGVFWVVPLADD